MNRIDEELARIRKVLEEIRDRLPTSIPMYHNPFWFGVDPNKCLICGGYHGVGVQCPKLSPTAISGDVKCVK